MKAGFYTYMLTDESKTLIEVGYTDKLEDLLTNAARKASAHSRKPVPHRLIWCEHHLSGTEAALRSRNISTASRRKKEELINNMNPAWKAMQPLPHKSSDVHLAIPDIKAIAEKPCCYIAANPSRSRYHVGHTQDIRNEMIHHIKGAYKEKRQPRTTHLLWMDATETIEAAKEAAEILAKLARHKLEDIIIASNPEMHNLCRKLL